MTNPQSFAAEGLGDPGSVSAPPRQRPRAGAGDPTAASAPGSRFSPWIAGILAGFPGLGSIYNGSYARGLAFFLTAAGTLYIAQRGQDLWGFVVAFVWLFNIVDAYREARLIRAGLAQDLAIARPRRAASAGEGLGLGVVLLVIGVVSFLDLSMGIDVDWIFHLWPIGLMAAGAWFIVSAVRRGRASGSPVSTLLGFDEVAEAAPEPARPDSRLVDEAPISGPPPEPPPGW